MLILFLFMAFDELVCVVDGEPIAKGEIYYVSMFYPGVGYDELLEKMINDEVIIRLAEAETLKVSEDEIAQMREELISNNPGLAAMLGKNAYMNEIYNKQIRVQIYTNRILGLKFRDRLRVSPAEINEFYRTHRDSLVMPESVTLEKIQIPVLPQEENYLLKKAEKILTEYREGEAFATLVSKYSDDVATIPYGGKLGELSPGDIPPHLTGVMELEEGGAEIFESPIGYHIIKLDERKGVNIVISQILLKFDFKEKEVESAEKKALEIKKQWSKGDSILPYKIETVGPLPVRAFPPAILSLIDTMNIGQITDPVLEGMYFHLFKVKNKEESRMPEFSEIRDRLSNVLMQQKMMKLLSEWLEDEKQHIYIKKI
ncbi:MAG: peptidylprolyl isomerase [candidate division WOR-3 bacterium]|jgi:peptidyl-prolyl cis-trans isomerase SurA